MFGLFENEDDSSCTAHHFGEWKDIDEFKCETGAMYYKEDNGRFIEVIKPPQYKYIRLLRKEESKCLHEKCSESKERWYIYKTILFDKPDEVPESVEPFWDEDWSDE